MDFENNGTNQQPNAEEAVEETQYTGCDEEMSEEITDEEYNQIVAEITEELPIKEKRSFFAELKNQAVCKMIFLFAAIGFIFPFFTVSCSDNVLKEYSTTGVDTFKKMSYIVGEYGEAILERQWLLIVAFAVIAIGLILTVLFRNEIRNIAGLVCSLVSAACIGVFYYMLPTLVSDSMNTFLTKLSKDISAAYGQTIDLTDTATLSQMGLDLSGLKAVCQPGIYFVFALLIVNAIYFIVQLSINGKRRADVEMTLTEGEFPEDFDNESEPEEADESSDCQEANEEMFDESSEKETDE